MSMRGENLNTASAAYQQTIKSMLRKERQQRREQWEENLNAINMKMMAAKSVMERMKKTIKDQKERKSAADDQTERTTLRQKVMEAAKEDIQLARELARAADDDARDNIMAQIKKRLHDLQEEEARANAEAQEKTNTVLRELNNGELDTSTFETRIKGWYKNAISVANAEIYGISLKKVATVGVMGLVAYGVGHIFLPTLLSSVPAAVLKNHTTMLKAMGISADMTNDLTNPMNTLTVFFFLYKANASVHNHGAATTMSQTAIDGVNTLLGVVVQGYVSPQVIELLFSQWPHWKEMGFLPSLGVNVVGAMAGTIASQVVSKTVIKLVNVTFGYDYNEVAAREQKMLEMAQKQEKIDYINHLMTTKNMPYDAALAKWESSSYAVWKKASAATAAASIMSGIIIMNALKHRNPATFIEGFLNKLLKSSYGKVIMAAVFQQYGKKLVGMIPTADILQWAVKHISNLIRKSILLSVRVDKLHDDDPLVIAHLLSPRWKKRVMKNTILRFLVTSSLYNGAMYLTALGGGAINNVVTAGLLDSPVQLIDSLGQGMYNGFKVSTDFEQAFDQAKQNGNVDAFINGCIQNGMKHNMGEFIELLKNGEGQRLEILDKYFGITQIPERIYNLPSTLADAYSKSDLPNYMAFFTDGARWERFVENAKFTHSQKQLDKAFLEFNKFMDQNSASLNDIQTLMNRIKNLQTAGVFIPGENGKMSLHSSIDKTNLDGANMYNVNTFVSGYNDLMTNIQAVNDIKSRYNGAPPLPSSAMTEDITKNKHAVDLDITEVKKRMEIMSTGIIDLSKLQDSVGGTLNINETQLQNIIKTGEGLQFNFMTYQSSIDKINARVNELYGLKNQLGKILDFKNAKNAYDSLDILNLETDVNNMNNLKRDIDTSFNDIKDSIFKTNVVTDVTGLYDNLSNISTLIEKLEGAIKSKQNDIENAKNVVKAYSEAFDGQIKLLHGKHSELKDKLADVAQLKSNVAAKANAVRNEIAELQVLQKMTSNLSEDAKASVYAKIEGLTQLQQKLAWDMIKIDGIQNELQDSIQGLDVALSQAHNMTPDQLKLLVSKYADVITNLQGKIDAINKHVQDSTEQLADSNTLRNGINTTNQALEKLKATERQVQELQEQASKLVNRLQKEGLSQDDMLKSINALASKLQLDPKNLEQLEQFIKMDITDQTQEGIAAAIKAFSKKVDERYGKGMGGCFLGEEGPHCMMDSGITRLVGQIPDPMSVLNKLGVTSTLSMAAGHAAATDSVVSDHIRDSIERSLSAIGEFKDRAIHSQFHKGRGLWFAAKDLYTVMQRTPTESQARTARLRAHDNIDPEEVFKDYVAPKMDERQTAEGGQSMYSKIWQKRNQFASFNYVLWGENSGATKTAMRALATPIDTLVTPFKLLAEGETKLAAKEAIVAGATLGIGAIGYATMSVAGSMVGVAAAGPTALVLGGAMLTSYVLKHTGFLNYE